MIIVMLFMLLAPGLIAVRVLWYKKTIMRQDYKFVACDYIVYSFLIQLVVYGFMFFTYPERTVSFAMDAMATSHILEASFVFKYSYHSLGAALVLSALVPRVVKFWMGLEEKRNKRLEEKKAKKSLEERGNGKRLKEKENRNNTKEKGNGKAPEERGNGNNPEQNGNKPNTQENGNGMNPKKLQ